MNYSRSNCTIEMPHNDHLKIPESRDEFSRLGYAERLQLQREYPALYQKFTAPRKPWEK